jgi:hypothetical protein
VVEVVDGRGGEQLAHRRVAQLGMAAAGTRRVVPRSTLKRSSRSASGTSRSRSIWANRSNGSNCSQRRRRGCGIGPLGLIPVTFCLRSRSARALWHKGGFASVGRSVSRSSIRCRPALGDLA